ncbi:hypothetical protein TVAG_248990 [Trichomonas vaginalis G3]|uniref:Importin N-terminal domain-containing protein n=1 Tax=Trichomonas vaginalis (strain ATCC PRA-98 / G3) TaxID=412133 RepID=A2DCA3_TRIV3|nr:armadillo (ARM) repeat-containing protein family [Trichomonas vaginalis G3]EAY21840.1 hypothetical protein TVAG_248990 [Trichomonas vaginalis G3]KAI5487690.1 armadillo (ARM) repeat-containing protein family [Trichomonas vaginalis G3]|eukprot:XP_001582826.1 hypothetical protein [Trichomonas vaginalis G3]
MINNEQLEYALRTINSDQENIRESSNKHLQELLQGPLLPIIESIALLIDAHSTETEFVRICVVMIGRILKIKYGRYAIKSKVWCSSNNLDFIHQTISALLTNDDQVIRQTSAFILAIFAEKEIPNGYWQDFYEVIFTEMQAKEKGALAVIGALNVMNELNQIETFINSKGFVPFISEYNPDFVDILQNTFEITTNWIQDNDVPIDVKITSLKLFGNFFNFFEFYVNEMEEVRKKTFVSLLSCLQLENDEVHKLAVWNLCKVVRKCYFTIDTFLPEIINFSVSDFESNNKNKILNVIELWIEIASTEIEVSESHNYIERSYESLLPFLIQNIRNFDDDNDFDDFNEDDSVHKYCQILLSLFFNILPNIIGPILSDIYCQNISSSDPYDRFASLLCLSCLISNNTKLESDENDDALMNFLQSSVSTVLALCYDDNVRVCENSLWVLSLMVNYSNNLINIENIIEVVNNTLQKSNEIIRERSFQLMKNKLENSEDYDAYYENICEMIFTCLNDDKNRNDFVLTSLFECLFTFIENLSEEFDISKIFIRSKNYLSEEVSDVTRKNRELVISFFMAEFSTFAVRFTNPSRYNFEILLYDMIDIVRTTIQNMTDPNILIEGLNALSLFVLLIRGFENIVNFADLTFPVISDILSQEENPSVTSRAALLLSDTIISAKKCPDEISGMYEAVTKLFHADNTTIDDKIRIITCLSSLLMMDSSFCYSVSSDFLPKCLDLMRTKVDSEDDTSLLIRIFICLSDSYRKFIAIMSEDIEFLDLNLRQFASVLDLFSKSMPVFNESYIWKYITYTSFLVTTFGTSVGEMLQNSDVPRILMYFNENSQDEKIRKTSFSVHQILMKS